MDELEELVDALLPVASALRKLGVRHYVGGSVASSFHGAARSTMDVDLVCELTEDGISPFIQSIGTDYYASETAMRDAVRRKGCFNLIHLPACSRIRWYSCPSWGLAMLKSRAFRAGIGVRLNPNGKCRFEDSQPNLD